MKKYLFLVTLFILCVQSHAQVFKGDWIAEPSEVEEGPSMWPQIPERNWIPVLKCQRAKALKMLKSKQFVALDARNLKMLTGISKKPNGFYYLIRSVRFREEYAGLSLGWKNQQL